MNATFSAEYSSHQEEIKAIIANFDAEGKTIYGGSRNTLKTVQLKNGQTINIKAFKVPNAVNRLAYQFLRKSKAERSFLYANRLLEKGIGTPQPVAYFEEDTKMAFGRSFYVSEHLDYDLTYRNLVKEDIPLANWGKILKEFTGFTYDLHEADIEFLDHSPGNTLIQIHKDGYEFYLVDLNRMNFKEMSWDDRLKNFAKLTPREDMVEIMAREYAQLCKADPELTFRQMWEYTQAFQERFHRKKRMKKKLKFWKK